jgi:hypothetical protein
MRIGSPNPGFPDGEGVWREETFTGEDQEKLDMRKPATSIVTQAGVSNASHHPASLVALT